MKMRLKIEIKIVLSWFEVYTVILFKYQVLLVFVGESLSRRDKHGMAESQGYK